MKKTTLRLSSILLLIIAVLLVSFISGCNDESIKVMFDEYEKSGGDITAIKTIAVLDFTGRNPGIGGDIAYMLADKLRAMGYFTVIDKWTAHRILSEKGLPTSGKISSEDARQIAEALGVDAIMFGTADANFVTAIKYREIYTYPRYRYPVGRGRRYVIYEPRHYVPYLSRNGHVNMDIVFYDARIRKDMGTITLRKNYSRDYDDYQTSRLGGRSIYFFDRLKTTEMPSDHDMLLLLAESSVSRVIANFTPYYVSRARKLQEGVPGADQALKNKWEEAKTIWERFVENSPANTQVNTNLGIYHERKGNPARALRYYQAALQGNPGDPVLEEYIRQVEIAARTKVSRTPVQLSQDTPRYRVVEVKEDNRVYLSIGVEDGVNPGDLFIIYHPRVEFLDDLVTPKGTVFYPVAEVAVEKTFEGVSWGTASNLDSGFVPRPGDIAVRK